MEEVQDYEYAHYDIVEDVLMNNIIRDFTQGIFNSNIEKINAILNEISQSFQILKNTDFIICPIPKLKLNDTINNDFFSVIPRHKSREEKIKLLAGITEIDEESIQENIEHTENTRSKDFMRHALLVVNYEHQDSFIKQNSTHIIKEIVNLLKAYYYGKIFDPSNRDIFEETELEDYKNTEENSHLCILSNEDIRCGNGVLDFSVECDFNINWLREVNHQNEFKQLIEKLLYQSTRNDEFSSLFRGALKTYNQSIEIINDREWRSVGVMLIITTLESLLSSNNYGSRTNVELLLPRLIEEDSRFSDRSVLLGALRNLYRIRNEFAHANKHINYSEENYNLLKVATGNLICLYPDFIEQISEDFDYSEGVTWSTFIKTKLDQAFEGKI